MGKNNGKYNILEKLPEELQQDLSDTGLRTFTLTTDEILQLERTILYKYKNVSWKIYFPEYEGGGDWAQIVLPAASILIPILADWLGITNPNLAKQRCHDRKMKKCQEIILKRYKSILQGELCMPQLQEVRYSSDGREVYRILEMDENGNTIQKYVARIAKRNCVDSNIQFGLKNSVCMELEQKCCFEYFWTVNKLDVATYTSFLN